MKTSPITENIFRALNEVTKEITNPKNSKVNPYFKSKYAPLSEVLELVRPLLAVNGLSITQELLSIDGKVGVSTLITHSSGEWVETEPFYLTMEKDTAQGAGSCITYARRYSLSAILGIS
jgi:ERF superfamily.